MIEKSDSNLSFKDKLKQLTQFNPALVYGFDPQASPKFDSENPMLEDLLFPNVGQYNDMLDGYLYAQNIFLPFITTNGGADLDAKTLPIITGNLG